MHPIAHFFTGALLCNALPHLASGLQGLPFPTPFARPRGVGNSAPLLNMLWGLANLALGLYLLGAFPMTLQPDADSGTALLGALAIGSYLALHFGKVQRERAAQAVGSR
jgi:hypothetical protein